MYIIECKTQADFIALTSEYMKSGIHFTANADTLTIKLTGGY